MAEEKDGSVIYQHPQSKLFSKMAGLVGLKTPVPALPADPVAVLDRKLEQEDRRLKKDNRRWRAVIYLTVTVCLIIFGLVLAQVITSVTSSSGHLPNIDVSEKKAASTDVPRHEPLVAGMSSAERQTVADKALMENVVAAASKGTEEIVLTTANGRPEDDYVLSIAETGRGNNLDITVKKEGENADGKAVKAAQAAQQAAQESREVHVGLAEEEPRALALGPEGRSGYVAYVPVPLGGEEQKTDTPTTTTTPRPQSLPTMVRNRPFFVPVMFQERRVPPPFRRPSPPFPRAPAPVMTPPRLPVRQPHRLPTRPAANQRPLFQGRPLLSLPPTSRQPLFQGRPAFSLPPTNQRPPFQGQMPTGLPLANQGRPLQGQTPRPQLAVLLQRPAGLPPSFNLQQNSNVQHTARPIGPLPLDSGDPFAGRMGSLLRNMRQLMSTARPLLFVEPTLPSNMSLSRLLGPRGPFGPPRPVPRRPLVPQNRGFPPRPPPAGLRPGPFRPPISVAPPRQAANQRVFAPRPTNQRPFPPRPLPAPAQPANQRVFNQQRDFVPPPRPVLHAPSENPSRRFPSQPSQTVTLVGNPQYNYPSTATGIQDILRYIQGEYRPQNGHGAYNRLSQQQQQQGGLNPNSPYASRGVNSNRFGSNGFGNNNNNNNNGFIGGGFGGSGSHSGGGRRQDGPIYPPGYQGQRFSLGSSRQPYRLMLDVYPMENSDRYQSSDIYVSPDNQNQYRNSNQNQFGNSNRNQFGSSNQNKFSSSGDYNQFDSGSSYSQYNNNNNGGNQFSQSDTGGRNRYQSDDNDYQNQYNSNGGSGNRDRYNQNGNQNYYDDGSRDDYPDDNKHEIVLHLNLYARRPNQYGGKGSHSSQRLSLDIPLRRNQLTPQLLYDAILAGKWRTPVDQPRFEFLQEEAASTRDKVGIDLFPIEEAPKILAALKSKLFEVPQPVLDLGPLKLPGDRQEDEEEDSRLGGRHQEQRRRYDEDQEGWYDDDQRRRYEEDQRRRYEGSHGDRRDEHSGGRRHEEDHRERYDQDQRRQHDEDYGGRYDQDQRRRHDEDHGGRYEEDKRRRQEEDHGGRYDQNQRRQHDEDYGGRYDQDQRRRYDEDHGGRYDQDQRRRHEEDNGRRRYGDDQGGQRHEEEQQASDEFPRWTSVQRVNDLTEGYLRPDQVTRPPVTSRPPAATYEPLPTPLASRRLQLDKDGAGGAGKGGASVDSRGEEKVVVVE